MSNGRVLGSYRDPAGFVFFHDERVFRAVREEYFPVIEQLDSDGILTSLSEEFGLIPTKIVVDSTDLAAFDHLFSETNAFKYLEHQRVASITYPYEWTVSMLADAAICTLDLQMALTTLGYGLKDATPFNVQFVTGRPKFIDIGSIERPKRLDIWFALGQYLQMFLYPLFLFRYRGWDLSSFFLARPNGRTLEEVARGFSGFERLRPILLLDLTLPLWLHRLSRKRRGRRRDVLSQGTATSSALLLNLRRLRRKTIQLASNYRPRSAWADYSSACNYSSRAEGAKKTFVEAFLRDTHPTQVLDIGCNTGDYSIAAAVSGAKVLAIDSDHDAVELLYRRVRSTSLDVTPLVGDLCNPSPGVGFMNTERTPLFQRIRADCVLCLALIHHLLISGNLSLVSVRDMLACLTTRDLVLEFVPTDDEMFQSLLDLRVDLFEGLTLECCRNVFKGRFSVLKEMAVPDSKRTLLFLRLNK